MTRLQLTAWYMFIQLQEEPGIFSVSEYVLLQRKTDDALLPDKRGSRPLPLSEKETERGEEKEKPAR